MGEGLVAILPHSTARLTLDEILGALPLQHIRCQAPATMPALSEPLQVASLVEAFSTVKKLAKVAIAVVASCIILASDSVVPIEERKESKLMMAAKELYHSITDKGHRWLNPGPYTR